MGYHLIGVIALFAGSLGLAYVAYEHFGPDQDRTAEMSVVEPEADEPTVDEPATPPVITGSAARRMDDFGSGPSGTAVTVPLRDRHRQAFTGGSAAGGGAEKATGKPRLEAMASPSDPEDATGDKGDDTGQKPSFRVVERDPQPASAESETASDADDAVSPTFDVVRVDPEGRTVMAGRAAPLTDVEVKAGDKVIDRVTTTAAGEWVSTPVESLESGDQELSLTALPKNDEPVESRQVVVVSIPEGDGDAQPEQPVAVALDKDEGGEGRILQAPDKLESAGDERLALKLVDYDDDGAIRLSGEAPPGVPVRIYIDNEPAALVIGDSKGYWITTLDQQLPGGDYTLRLDQLDAKGQTVARLETPLTRVATPPAEGEAKVDYVVVQPGNSLWRIARRLSGDGFNYVYIFEANQAQIRDPDVIYPGQVFEVPADVAAQVLAAPG